MKQYYENLNIRLKDLDKSIIYKYEEQLKFDKYIQEMINSICVNRRSFLFYYDNYKKALEELRIGNILTAEALILRAKKYIHKSLLTNEEEKMYDLICKPIDAYLFYKKKNYNNAIIETKETMILDSYFEKQFPIVFYHKIQQIHNLSRIYFRKRKIVKAIELLNSIFTLLIDKIQINYEQVEYEPYYLDLNRNNLRKSMIYSILNDTVMIAEHFEKKDKILILSFCDEIINKPNLDFN